VWRGNRRLLLLFLGGSLAVGVGLLAGALGHRWATYAGMAPALRVQHLAVEGFLWAGAVLSLGIFLAAAVGFRREVRAEKKAKRRKKDRRELVDLVMRYERDSNGRMNN